MAPLPKRKHTPSRSRIRRNSPAKKGGLPVLTVCPSCKKPTLPHKVCRHCGHFPN